MTAWSCGRGRSTTSASTARCARRTCCAGAEPTGSPCRMPRPTSIAHVAGAGVIAEHAKWYQRFEPKRGLTQPPPAQQVRVRIVGRARRQHRRALRRHPCRGRGGDGALGARAPRPAGRWGRRAPAAAAPAATSGMSAPDRCGCPDCWASRATRRARGRSRRRRCGPTVPARGSSTCRVTSACRARPWARAPRSSAAPRCMPGSRPPMPVGRACSAADLPESADADAVHTPLGWSAEEYATNRPYLLQPPRAVPVRRPRRDGPDHRGAPSPPGTPTPTSSSARAPTRAWRRADGRWVLRETKTLSPRGLPGGPHPPARPLHAGGGVAVPARRRVHSRRRARPRRPASSSSSSSAPTRER